MSRMSFGSDLKEKFDILTRGSRYIEVELFTKLQDALILLEKSYGPYGIKLIHGDRSKVTFTVSSNHVTGTMGTTKKRELADMFFVVMSPSKKKIRLFFLQNKSYADFMPNHMFQADLMQLDLLKNRLEFEYKGRVNNILEKAKMPSIASYGVFYWDKKFNYDMAYMRADSIDPVKYSGMSLSRTVQSNAAWGMKYRVNGHRQLDGCITLEEFADGMIDMTIGEPVCCLKAIGYICGYEIETMCRELLRNDEKVAWDARDLEWDEQSISNQYGKVKGIATKGITIINADTLKCNDDK